MSTKFAPRLRARTIWKSKSLKTESIGRFFEVEVAKICTTPARENDLEVKIVKTPGSRDVFFEVQSWFKMLFVWQAHGFRHSIIIKIAKIAKTYCKSEVKRLLNMSYFWEVPTDCPQFPITAVQGGYSLLQKICPFTKGYIQN